jgi:hypothetical protein
MKQTVKALVVSAVLGGVSVAQAHPNHDDPLDTVKKAAPRSIHRVEAVAKDGKVHVTVTRDGKKISTANAQGALVMAGAKPRVEYLLQSDGENRLVTRDKVSLPAGTRVTVAVSLGDRSNVTEDVTVR